MVFLHWSFLLSSAPSSAEVMAVLVLVPGSGMVTGVPDASSSCGTVSQKSNTTWRFHTLGDTCGRFLFKWVWASTGFTPGYLRSPCEVMHVCVCGGACVCAVVRVRYLSMR